MFGTLAAISALLRALPVERMSIERQKH